MRELHCPPDGRPKKGALSFVTKYPLMEVDGQMICVPVESNHLSPLKLQRISAHQPHFCVCARAQWCGVGHIFPQQLAKFHHHSFKNNNRILWSAHTATINQTPSLWHTVRPKMQSNLACDCRYIFHKSHFSENLIIVCITLPHIA